MRIPHFLALSLLISTWIAPAVAQSAPDKTPTPAQVPFDGKVPPLKLGPNVPQLFSKGEAGVLGDQIPVPFPMNQSSRNRITLAPNSGVCYSMRNYGFTRDNPVSDATSLSSYSTCQSSAQFEVKLVVDPRPTNGR